MTDIQQMRRDATSQGDTRIVIVREFEAPREMLWEAWTSPGMMAQWFAPEPLTVPRAEIDARPGGKYTLVMRDEDGNEFPSTGTYREVVRPERLVYEDSVAEMPPSWVDLLNEARVEAPGTPVPDGIATLTFEDLGGDRTRMTFDEEFGSQALRDAYVEMQMVEGLQMTLDNLARLLSARVMQPR